MNTLDDLAGNGGGPHQPDQTPPYPQLRVLLDDYLQMYAGRDDRLTTRFSENFSGFTGGGDFLVKDKAEWVAITRQDFAQVKDALRLELKDVAIQSLAETIAVATSFFTIHLPIKDNILSRETARLVLIFRKESSGWQIAHSSISIPYQGVRAGEVYPLQNLVERNRVLEEQVAERTSQVSIANTNLLIANVELAREVAEHKETERQLQALLVSRTRELREATAAALRAGAEEENRIGRELHDRLCPDLIGLARHAEALASLPEPPLDLSECLRDLADKATIASRRARNLSHLLALPDFVHADFAEQLQGLLSHLEKTLEVTCELTLDDTFVSLSPEKSGHLIRIVREAVTNAAFHGRARRVWIDCVRQADRVTLSISNDGRPMPPAATLTVGLGIRQMRMRADLLEAEIVFANGQAGGALVELTLPLPANGNHVAAPS